MGSHATVTRPNAQSLRTRGKIENSDRVARFAVRTETAKKCRTTNFPEQFFNGATYHSGGFRHGGKAWIGNASVGLPAPETFPCRTCT